MINKEHTTPEPWFGSWPPEMRGEDPPMKLTKMVQGVKLHTKIHWNIIIPFILFGFLLLVLSHIIDQKICGAILEHTGIALVVASLLGGTIEGFLRKDLIDDAFKASIGYLLPDEIKGEMQWIYEQSQLATYRHDFRIENHPNNPEKVIVHQEINKTFKNISNKDLDINPSLGIEEWFHPEGYSEILAYDLTCGDEIYSYENGKIEIGKAENDKQSNYILAVKKKPKISLPHKGEYCWVARFTEVKHRNDVSISFFTTATIKPYITMKLPNDMDFDITLGHRQENLLARGSDHFELQGVLLPGQAIRVRWWVKADSEKWQQEIDTRYEKTKSN